MIKSFTSKQEKFLTDLTLLSYLIKSRDSLPTGDYQQLITYFLRTKCIKADPAYATLIKSNPSILSSNNTFKVPSDLIDKHSNPLFPSLFQFCPSLADDLFLNDHYYNNDVVMLALSHLGLIANKLPERLILFLASSVEQLQTSQAKMLSRDLLKYCQLNPINCSLSSQLQDIKWVTIYSTFH